MSAINKLCASLNAAIKGNKVSFRTANSKFVVELLKLFMMDGFIRSYTFIYSNSDDENYLQTAREIQVFLSFFNGRPVLKQMLLVSKQGRPVFASCRALKLLTLQAYGTSKLNFLMKSRFSRFIISTSQGLLTEKQALLRNCGGEVICKLVV